MNEQEAYVNSLELTVENLRKKNDGPLKVWVVVADATTVGAYLDKVKAWKRVLELRDANPEWGEDAGWMEEIELLG